MRPLRVPTAQGAPRTARAVDGGQNCHDHRPADRPARSGVHRSDRPAGAADERALERADPHRMDALPAGGGAVRPAARADAVGGAADHDHRHGRRQRFQRGSTPVCHRAAAAGAGARAARLARARPPARSARPAALDEGAGGAQHARGAPTSRLDVAAPARRHTPAFQRGRPRLRHVDRSGDADHYSADRVRPADRARDANRAV